MNHSKMIINKNNFSVLLYNDNYYFDIRIYHEQYPGDEAAWSRWIAASPTQLRAALEVFRRVSEGEV